MISLNLIGLILVWLTIVQCCIATPLVKKTPTEQVDYQSEDDLIPVSAATLKKILLYNRLQQLADADPEQSDNDLFRLRSYPNYYLNTRNTKRAAAMGVDLPDYILHINKGRNFDFSAFRDKMQKSG